jgi:hypothetical protein
LISGFRVHHADERIPMNYRLSPSDLTFLYDGCKRCFVLKVKNGIAQPSIPIPGVFTTIAALQKECYSGKRTESVSDTLPPGTMSYGEKRVRSGTIQVPGSTSTCSINGRFDIVAELDDGSYAVMDFKTGNPADEKTTMYARQLHAYAIALENPAEGALHLAPVTTLGLLYFIPDSCQHIASTRQILEGQINWVEVDRDDESFMTFLHEVIGLLEGPLPPPQPKNCEWCRYLETTRQISAGAGEREGTAEAITSPPSCPQCNGPMRMRTGRYGDFWSCIRYPECRGTRNSE